MGANAIQACAVFCMDYRLHKQFWGFLESTGLLEGGVDVVRLAGVARNLAPRAADVDRAFLLGQLRISKALHGIRQVVLINHEDCGAYRPDLVPDGPSEEALHLADLATGRALILAEIPGVEVLTYMMAMDGTYRLIEEAS